MPAVCQPQQLRAIMLNPIQTLDANEAVAAVAHRLNEVIVIYPITPSSPMGESCDEWSAHGRANLWGAIPDVVEMQSEGGAIGAVHGALQAGSLATTFTASQGLLLMIPNLYKIAGELTPFCFHVAARTIATHALSIFGDHSDVMACRQTGVAMLCSNSVQEAQDFACIGQAATLLTRVPVLHFFDGFRTSHEVAKIIPLSDDDLRALMPSDAIAAHRRRALTPDRPVLRGTAQNPDVFFQAREGCNRFYQATPAVVQQQMDHFAERTGRRYRLFDYFGHPDADRVIVLMGSGVETARETVEHFNALGERLGVLAVRLFRPFSVADFVAALPSSAKLVAVLDRTKEPGAVGEPLYLDVVSALHESGRLPHVRVIGGRYGLSSKEFTPAMVRTVFDNLANPDAKNHFTVGIVDDVTHTSLKFEAELDIESRDVVRAVFYGLGSDGTVGANKNTIKILGEGTDQFAQGYFVYDSKKSGSVTVSHLRFGPRPIRSAYLIAAADFLACHQWSFIDRLDMTRTLRPGGTFLLNSPYPADDVWDRLPREVQTDLIGKRARFWVINADRVASAAGLGGRIGTVMQTCFFALAGVLPRDEAIERIRSAVKKSFARKGEELVRRNFEAIDRTLAELVEVTIPDRVTASHGRPPQVATNAPDFVQRVTAVIMAGLGDNLPVSAFPVDGTWPTGTARWEKRTVADAIPIWDSKLCIQCNKCVFVCPHSAIRAKEYDPAPLADAPPGFLSTDFRAAGSNGRKYTIQVAPQDCTGCNLCVAVCPAKDKSNPKHKAIDMAPLSPILNREIQNYDFFLGLPDSPLEAIEAGSVKASQFRLPLFEYSGACAGCGETPYLKLLTQLCGDRLLIANATGCSSIYGGNLPTTPWSVGPDGRGPAWSNSLFEDNAEFGFGMRISLDAARAQAIALIHRLTGAGAIPPALATAIFDADQSTDAGVQSQRKRVAELRTILSKSDNPLGDQLLGLADYLTQKSVWLIGGDGWAYDIGFGGLDHVLSMTRNIKVLVVDTEVYSNTGGQASKSTPLGASAKFASAGKAVHKKDLGFIAMTYGHVYVASVAFGASDTQTVRAFQEAMSYDGPSLIIAYSHCIAHGYDLRHGADQQKLAVESGIWPLYRFDPRKLNRGEPPLTLDSHPGRRSVAEYMRNEGRFRVVEQIDPKRFRLLGEQARAESARRVDLYEQLARIKHQSAGRNEGTP